MLSAGDLPRWGANEYYHTLRTPGLAYFVASSIFLAIVSTEMRVARQVMQAAALKKIATVRQAAALLVIVCTYDLTRPCDIDA